MPANLYPALMTYIATRNAQAADRHWCDPLREDTAAALTGEFAAVAADLARAQADYATASKAKCHDGYPYNSAMAGFLGLPLREDGRETAGAGYYMAGQVMDYWRLGVAQRDVARLIAEGKPLLVATARDKVTRKAIRCTRFVGPDQIKVLGNSIEAKNGKRIARLSSNWSVETCLQKAAAAMAAGLPYGEAAA